MRVFADYNAGAPVRPEAEAALLEALRAGGNASSIHAVGRAQKGRLERAREALAGALGAEPQNLVFTSGATEAAHLVMAAACVAGFARLIVSAVEHDAVFEEARARGAAVAPVDADGRLDLAAFEALCAQAGGAFLACVMLANNETGVLQPVAEAARLVRLAGGVTLCDASQALGRVPVDLQALEADYVIASSHKVGGPPGAGVIALAPGAPFATVHRGGGQERGRRPGTENPPAIAGFGAAAAAALVALPGEAARLKALRDRFEHDLAASRSEVVFFGRGADRLPNTSAFALPGVLAETAVISLDLAGLAVSSGAACSSGKVKESRVLAAMGVPEALRGSALRVSLGWSSAERDVDALVAGIAALRSRTSARILQGAA